MNGYDDWTREIDEDPPLEDWEEECPNCGELPDDNGDCACGWVEFEQGI